MSDREFAPPFWLSNAHAQTVFGRLVRSRRLVALRREAIVTPDDDELFLDHLDGTDPQRHFVLLHGLEGSSYSVYIQGLLSILKRHGVGATAINFRSCARDPERLSRMLPNRRPRFYHSGETSDFDFVVRMLASRLAGKSLLAFGASLGGNALLKWLGEHPGQQIVTAAATISVPYDLGAGAALMDQTFSGRVYVNSFLRTLKKKIAETVRRFPETARVIDVERALNARTFRDFDDAATGPLHGFRDADDYYARSSSLGYLPHITTPVLCLSAADDPFLPADALERARAAASPFVDFRVTPTGGHVGFIGGSTWRFTYWAEELVVSWLLDRGSRSSLAATAP